MFKFRFRLVWWHVRKQRGHPITVWRALFGAIPQFGAYEEHEKGCPEWDKQSYELVKKA